MVRYAEKKEKTDAWTKIGKGFLEAENYTGATHAFSKALEWSRYDIQAMLGLSRSLLKQGKMDEAYRIAWKASEKAPTNPEVWYHLAVVYDVWGNRLDKVAKSLENCLQHMQDYLDAAEWLARVNAELEEKRKQGKAEREETVTKPLKVHVPNPEALEWFERGLEQYHAGKYKDCEKSLKKAIKLDEEYAEPWFTLAQTHVKRGKQKEALHAFRLVFELNPMEPVAWCNLGVLLAEMGEKEDAIRALQQAIKLDPDYALAWQNLTQIGGGVITPALAWALGKYGSIEEMARANKEQWDRLRKPKK